MKGVGGKRWFKECRVAGYPDYRTAKILEWAAMQFLPLAPAPQLRPDDDGIEIRMRYWVERPVAYAILTDIDDGYSL